MDPPTKSCLFSEELNRYTYREQQLKSFTCIKNKAQILGKTKNKKKKIDLLNKEAEVHDPYRTYRPKAVYFVE